MVSANPDGLAPHGLPQPLGTPPVLDVDLGLTLKEGKRRFDLAVRFAVHAPVTALYGPSGAGKSLTLQAIAGLRRPATGHVRIAGHTWFDASQGILVPTPARRVGYLFQHYALFPHLTVRQNIAFGLTRWNRPRLSLQQQGVVDDLLQTFGLAELAHSRPLALSGGQQQRVALARALACEPQVLLLDEPFAALNPMLRATLRQELARIRARCNIPMVMITHDVDDVLALADVALVMEQGRVVQELDLRMKQAAQHHTADAPQIQCNTQTQADGLRHSAHQDHPARRLLAPDAVPDSPHTARLRRWLGG